VGFANRGPEGRSHSHFERYFFRFSCAFVFAVSFSLGLLVLANMDGKGALAPAVVPARSLLLYPNIESPSSEF
jgi:hypothetical protein